MKKLTALLITCALGAACADYVKLNGSWKCDVRVENHEFGPTKVLKTFGSDILGVGDKDILGYWLSDESGTVNFQGNRVIFDIFTSDPRVFGPLSMEYSSFNTNRNVSESWRKKSTWFIAFDPENRTTISGDAFDDLNLHFTFSGIGFKADGLCRRN